MVDAREVVRTRGVDIPISMINRRLDAAAAMVGHRMSMLQDLERGRTLEVGVLVEAVQEAGLMTGVPTPMLDSVLALVRERSLHAG